MFTWSDRRLIRRTFIWSTLWSRWRAENASLCKWPPPLPWALSYDTQDLGSLWPASQERGGVLVSHTTLVLLHPHAGMFVVMLLFCRGELLVFWQCQAAPVTGCCEQGAPAFPHSPTTPDTQEQPELFAWIVKTKQSIVSMSLLFHFVLDDEQEKQELLKLFSPKKPLNLRTRTAQWSCTCIFLICLLLSIKTGVKKFLVINSLFI